MKTRDKVIILVCVFVCTLAIGGYIGTKYFLDKDIENSKKELEQVKKKYGSVEKESVATTVAKFNTQVMEKTNWKLLPVSDSNMVKHEKNYWFPIMEDISLVVMPDKYTGDKAKDISKRCMIHFPKDSKYKEQAMEYFKYLIFANNEKITEDEAKDIAVQRFTALGEENVSSTAISVKKIRRSGEEYYYITSAENTLEVKIKGGKITRVNSVIVDN